MYEYQGVKLSRLFELLPDSVPAALGFMNPEPPTRSARRDFRARTCGGQHSPSLNLGFLFYEEKRRRFCGKPILLGGCDRINITLLGPRVTILISLSQPNKKYYLLTNTARLALFNAPKNEQDLLQTTNAAVSMDLSKIANTAMEVLYEAINSVRIIHDVEVRDVEEHHGDTGEQ